MQTNDKEMTVPKNTNIIFDLDVAFYNNKYPQLNWEKAKRKYSEKKLNEYGTLPWEIQHTYKQLVTAFKTKNKAEIIQKSADLGHYISDAHVPLHTTENYDGQLTNQLGLHSLWETEAIAIGFENLDLSSIKSCNKIKNIEKQTWEIIKATAKLVPSVIETEKQLSADFSPDQKYKYQERNGKQERKYSGAFIKAYWQKLNSQINTQLLKSAEMTSRYWFTAYEEAGKPNLESLYDDKDKLKVKLADEKKAWQNNELLSKQLLRAKNGNK